MSRSAALLALVLLLSSCRDVEAEAFARAQLQHRALIDQLARPEDPRFDPVLAELARPVATAAGLDAKQMRAEVEAGTWKAEMEAGLAAAAELGISAVPTFIVGNKFAIQGAQEARVFRQAFERVQRGI